MHAALAATIGVMLLVCLPAGVMAASTPVASPVTTPVDARSACPVTQPNNTEPNPAMPEPLGPATFENDVLRTNLWMWGKGVVQVPADGVEADGSTRDLKWAWIRRVPGELTIEGRRIDGPAGPLTASVPEGYGRTGFQVSGIGFATPGCWEVTGSIDGHDLTFVLWVIYP